ncbi:hypothetical protein [Halomonas urumqiensis]|uniref:GNAT family N-acetyltransferase n=1 Tax=Halomonas urumqiensis TaxID=1684789 RepID=A0A2N7UKQ3_9GAMM|nr:hypothetical protein [Halomonas urumqiensis]PMR81017.1 hypothetical protein C1H70_06375 [Halomonas urumqiensis]PTB01126.1 hypothetical protein C6V82_17010 [Halomonas urumqiensis]
MKVVSLPEGERRDDCLARLCAAFYGTAAGLAPLVAFSGTRHQLFPAEAARLWALVDERDSPAALALLVLDAQGPGMTLTLATSLVSSREPLARLLRELALNAPLRVVPSETLDEDFLRQCGIKRWLEGEDGQRTGLTFQHPAGTLDDLSPPLAVDENALLRRFKHDARFFEGEKQAFVDGLAH